jgi:acetylornithine aminotransferase
VQVPAADYLNQIRAICDEHDWLMMLDEIQTGMGRTGRMFGFEHSGAVPDVMTLAKGLGNGMPIGACLAREEAALLFKPGNHGSTFGGNPLACAAALAVVDVFEKEGVVAHAEKAGTRLRQTLGERLAGCDAVTEVRGQGLLVGIELDRPCGVLVGRALEKGLLINVTADKVVRLLPPLIISDEQVDRLATELSALIRAFAAESRAA